jgi:hypothetical protein
MYSGRVRKAARVEQCTRTIAEQVADPSGAIRRVDHPRDALQRLDLLDDVELDQYRARHPDRSAAALDAHELLLEAFENRAQEIDEAARRALEDRIRERPLLTVVVCTECGRFEVCRSARRWDVDRAMRRSSVSERDLVRVAVLLAEAWAEVDEHPPQLDVLTVDQINELRALIGQDVDYASLRSAYGRPR